MSIKRILMGTAAIVCLVVTVLIVARDVRVDDTTCGNALLRRDPLETLVRTGDKVEDALVEDRLVKLCDRGIARQRLLAVFPLAGGLAAVVVGRRWRDEDERRERDDHR